jgi:hypothetical protein
MADKATFDATLPRRFPVNGAGKKSKLKAGCERRPDYEQASEGRRRASLVDDASFDDAQGWAAHASALGHGLVSPQAPLLCLGQAWVVAIAPAAIENVVKRHRRFTLREVVAMHSRLAARGR